MNNSQQQQKKKKKHFKKNAGESDPIIKKIKTEPKPKNSQPKNPEPVPQDDPIEEQEEEKLNYDKFMDLFQEKKSKTEAKLARKQAKAVNRVLVKETSLIQHPLLETQANTEDPFALHYGLEQNTLIKQKLVLTGEKGPETIANQALVQKDFFYAFEEQEDLEVLNTEKETVGNQIKMREYELKSTLKGAGKVYQDEAGEIWASDLKAETHCNGKGGVLTKPIVKKAFEDHVGMEQEDGTNALLGVFPAMESYYDVIYSDPNEEFVMKFRRLWILHVLNHIKKAQEIEAENEKIKKEGEKNEEEQEAIADKLQKFKGYTRPRVLVLVPYKGDAYEIITMINEMFSSKDFKQKNQKVQKFMEEFGNEEDMLDDDFKIGLAFKDNKTILYNPFAHSDIIISSPLGLRRLVGAEGDKEREYSFMSSLEIFVMERAHVLFMQNWQHMDEILPMFNRMPRHKDMTNDLNEIRPYYFENVSKFYRQNIVYTEHKFAELNAINARYFTNYQGCLTNKCSFEQIIPESELEINQEFMKFDVDNFQKEADYRFEFFKTKVWEKIRFNEDLQKVVLFVSSYFDFIRLRSYFKKINASVGFISEYTERNKVQSRIANFLNGKQKFMLVTERAHFFSVCKIRKFSHIVFYSLPRNASIYKELIMSIDKIKEAEGLPRDKARKLTLRVLIRSMFTRFDAMALERIVGSDKCKEYIAEYNKGTTFIL